MANEFLKEIIKRLEQDHEDINNLADALATFGIAAKDENGDWRDTASILKDLNQVWQRLNTTIALIEIGNQEKEGFVMTKGSLVGLEGQPAHTYYYPETLTYEEFLAELEDLIEHYEHVAILTPLPQGWGELNDT